MGDKFKLLVREWPGKRVLHKLSNTTAFNTRDRCGRPGCLPCSSSNLGSKGACWLNGPTYEIKCGPSGADGRVTTYVGESGYSAYSRGGLHLAGLKAEAPRSCLWEHTVLHHGGRAGDGKKACENFTMKVTSSNKSASRRLITEGILIEEEVKRKNQARRERDGEEKILVLNSVKQ